MYHVCGKSRGDKARALDVWILQNREGLQIFSGRTPTEEHPRYKAPVSGVCGKSRGGKARVVDVWILQGREGLLIISGRTPTEEHPRYKAPVSGVRKHRDHGRAKEITFRLWKMPWTEDSVNVSQRLTTKAGN